MKTQDIKLNEIVFERRIKDYGAYALRKVYNKTLSKAVFFSVLFFLTAVSVPLIANYFKKGRDIGNLYGGGGVIIDKPPIDKPEIKQPKLPEVQKQNTPRFTAPLVVNEDVPDIDMDSLKNLADNRLPIDSGNFIFIPDKDTNNHHVITIDKPKETYLIVTEMPEFPGGDAGRVEFLSVNIKYPQMAKETGVMGKVYVNFVIDENGYVVESKLIRGIGGGCDEEAMRVIRSMPKWKSGKQNGIPVRVQFSLPIEFTLR
jgi:protein TonB